MSLSAVDRALDGVRPARPTIKGRQRALYRLADVTRALSASPSRLSGPTSRLLRAACAMVQDELTRLETAHVQTADVARCWGAITAHLVKTLTAWPASVPGETLARAAPPARADGVRALLRPVLEQLAASRPGIADPAAPRSVVGAAKAVTVSQLRARLLDLRAALAEARHRVRTGALVRREAVEHDWMDRVLRAREALWGTLPARAALLPSPDAGALRQLLADGVREALALLRPPVREKAKTPRPPRRPRRTP